MKKIGITGGIGSGKSRICNLLEEMGIPIYYTDNKAKELMVSNLFVRLQVIKEFGIESYNADNTLNRLYLASIVFSDNNKRNKLEDIIHPILLSDFDAWCLTQKNKNFIGCESAILYRTNLDKKLDIVVYITAPIEERINRVIIRDNSNREDILKRMAAQVSEEYSSEYIIENNDGVSDINLIAQISKILIKLKQ